MLLPGNVDAAEIYSRVRNQVITYFDGQRTKVMDLNYLAVKMMMDLYGVGSQKECFERVVSVFHTLQGEKNAT